MRARIQRIGKSDVLIGVFHRRQDGSIALVGGWDARERSVAYALDDDAGVRIATEAEYEAWTAREDLADFPDARDPALPYVFDLNFDLKHRSALVRLLKDAEAPADEIRAMMKDHGIVLDEAEEAEIARAAAPTWR
jgi:hypothetical protein